MKVKLVSQNKGRLKRIEIKYYFKITFETQIQNKNNFITNQRKTQNKLLYHLIVVLIIVVEKLNSKFKIFKQENLKVGHDLIQLKELMIQLLK